MVPHFLNRDCPHRRSPSACHLRIATNLNSRSFPNEDRFWDFVSNALQHDTARPSPNSLFHSSSPGAIVAHTQSVTASLVIWVVAALLAWTGASSFAELGASLPRNGGAQAYLAYTYGPLVSYLFTWTAILLLSPGSLSMHASL